MSVIHDNFGIRIIERESGLFLQYDAGELVIQTHEIAISNDEAEQIMSIESSDMLYKYLIENLNDRMNI